MIKVIRILPHVRQGPTYSAYTCSQYHGALRVKPASLETDSISNLYLSCLVISHDLFWSSHYSCISCITLFTDRRNTFVVILTGAYQSLLSLVDFDRHLGDENPCEIIDETYLCGQQWPNHGIRIRREPEYEFHLSTYVCSVDVYPLRAIFFKENINI